MHVIFKALCWRCVNYSFSVQAIIPSNSMFTYIFSAAGLSYGTDEMSLREAFGHYGQVVDGNFFFVSFLCL